MASQASRRRAVKVLVAVLLVAAAATGLGVGLHALWSSAKAHFASDTCTVGTYDLDPDQAAVAVDDGRHGDKLQLPQRAAVLVLAAGLQESKLTNLAPGDGDRDSVGVLQQRPSQGWGNVSGATDTIAARTARLTERRRGDAGVPGRAGEGRRTGGSCRSPRPSRRCRSPPTAAPTPSTSRRPPRWPRRWQAPSPPGSPATSTRRPRWPGAAVVAPAGPYAAGHHDADRDRPDGPGAGRTLADRELVRRQRRPAGHRRGGLRRPQLDPCRREVGGVVGTGLGGGGDDPPT